MSSGEIFKYVSESIGVIGILLSIVFVIFILKARKKEPVEFPKQNIPVKIALFVPVILGITSLCLFGQASFIFYKTIMWASPGLKINIFQYIISPIFPCIFFMFLINFSLIFLGFYGITKYEAFKSLFKIKKKLFPAIIVALFPLHSGITMFVFIGIIWPKIT